MTKVNVTLIGNLLAAPAYFNVATDEITIYLRNMHKPNSAAYATHPLYSMSLEERFLVCISHESCHAAIKKVSGKETTKQFDKLTQHLWTWYNLDIATNEPFIKEQPIKPFRGQE